MSSSEAATDDKQLTAADNTESRNDELLMSIHASPATITPATLLAHGTKTTIFKLENTGEFDAEHLKREEGSSFEDSIHISMIASLEDEILGNKGGDGSRLKKPREKMATGVREKRGKRPKMADPNSSEQGEMNETPFESTGPAKKGRRPKRMRKNSDKADDSLLDSSCSRDQHFSMNDLMKDGGSSLDILNHSQCSNSSSNDAYGSSKSHQGSLKVPASFSDREAN